MIPYDTDPAFGPHLEGKKTTPDLYHAGGYPDMITDI